MPIPDKVAAAHQINDFLKDLIAAGGFTLKYRITVEPKLAETLEDPPDILVEFAGPDSPLLLDRGAEVLRSFEHLTQEMLRLGQEEHNRVAFDCRNYRASRLLELKTAAGVAAERVRKTGVPYEFGPMSSRDRRILHLALREDSDLKTESAGIGPGRCVVVYPKDYKTESNARPAMAPSRRR